MFFQTLPNKISLALILKRKSCICCCKHCIAYFRRHMECAVLKRFLKVQGTFLKKFLQTPLFHLEKIKFNFFIKALLKGFTPHPLRLRLSTFSTVEKALKPFRQATLVTFPFRDGLLLAILYLVPKYRDKSRYLRIKYKFSKDIDTLSQTTWYF